MQSISRPASASSRQGVGMAQTVFSDESDIEQAVGPIFSDAEMESDDARPRRPWAASPANAKLRKDYVSRYSDYSSSRSAPQPPPPPPTTGPSARLRRPMAASPEHFRQRQQYRTLVRAALTAASKGDLSIVETLRRHSVSTFPKGAQAPPCGSLLDMANAVAVGDAPLDQSQPPTPAAGGMNPSRDAHAAASELAAPPPFGGVGYAGVGAGGSATLSDPGYHGGGSHTPNAPPVNSITPHSGSAASTAVSGAAGGLYTSGLAMGVGAGGSSTRRVVRSSSARSMSAGGFGRTSAPHGFGDSGVLARSDGVPTDAEWTDLVRDADHAGRGGLPSEGFYGNVPSSESHVERANVERLSTADAEGANGGGVSGAPSGDAGVAMIVTGNAEGSVESIASVSVDAVADAGAAVAHVGEASEAKGTGGSEAVEANVYAAAAAGGSGPPRVGADGGAPPICPVQPPLDAAAERAAAAAAAAGASIIASEAVAVAPPGRAEAPVGGSAGAGAGEAAPSGASAPPSAFMRPSSAGAGSGARPASGSTTGGGASVEGMTPPNGGLSSHVAPSAHAVSSTSSSSAGRAGSGVGAGVGVAPSMTEKRPQRVVGAHGASGDGRMPVTPLTAAVASSSRFSSRPMSAASGLWSDAGGGGEDERTPLDVVDDAELFAPSGSRRPPGSNSSRSPTPLMPGDDAVANALANVGTGGASQSASADAPNDSALHPNVRSVAGPAAASAVGQAAPPVGSAAAHSDVRSSAAAPAPGAAGLTGGAAASGGAELATSALSVGGPASPQSYVQPVRTAVGSPAGGGGAAATIGSAPAQPVLAAPGAGAPSFSPADRVRDPGAPVRPVERARSAKRERRVASQSEQHTAANAHLQGQQYAALLQQQQLQASAQMLSQQQPLATSANSFVAPPPASRPDEPSSTTATAASTVVGGGASHAAPLPTRASAFVPSGATSAVAQPAGLSAGEGRTAVPLGGPLSSPHAALEQPMSLTARAALRDRAQTADATPRTTSAVAAHPATQAPLSLSLPTPPQPPAATPPIPQPPAPQPHAQSQSVPSHVPSHAPPTASTPYHPAPTGWMPNPQAEPGPFGGVGGVGVGVGPGSAPPGSLAVSSGGLDGGAAPVAPDYGMTSMALRSYFGEVTAHELDTMASTLATAARVRDMAERERARAAFVQPSPAPNPTPHAGVWETAGITAPSAAPPAPARDVSPLPDPAEPYQRRVARACKELDSRNGSPSGSRSASASPFGRGGLSSLGAVPGVVFGSPEAALAALSAGGAAVPGGGVYHTGRAGRVVGSTTVYNGRNGTLRGGSAPPAGTAGDLRIPSLPRDNSAAAGRGCLPAYIADGPVYVRAGAPADRLASGSADTPVPAALGGAAAIGGSATPSRPLATFFADVGQPAPTPSGVEGGVNSSSVSTSGGRRDLRVPRNGASIWAQ